MNLQGGGVLNDMMCHSVEVARFGLTKPGAAARQHPVQQRSLLRSPRSNGRARSTRGLLQEMMGKEVDYSKKPSEDFARATINYVDEDGLPLIAEVTTSWSYVGAGLRLSTEILGPEYSMSINTLDSGLTAFLQPPGAR